MSHKVIIYGKVELEIFTCHHPMFRHSWSGLGRLYSPLGLRYEDTDEIIEPFIMTKISFRPALHIGYWEEIRRTDNLSEHLVPNQDYIEINGRQAKIEEKIQRLDDGAILYRVDYPIRIVDDEHSLKDAKEREAQANQVNKKKEERLRKQLENPQLSEKFKPAPRLPWYKRFWKKVFG